MIRCIALSPAVDVTYATGAGTLAPGSITRPTAVHRRAGGKGANVARAVRALGGDSTLVAPLGGPTGRWFGELARSEGLVTHLVEAAGETRLCLTFADTRGAPTEIYEPAPLLDDGAWAALLAAEEDATAAWTVVSGSAAGTDPARLAALVETAARRRPVALDAHGPAVAAALRAGLPVALLKVNRDEAAALLATPSDTGAVDLCTALARTSGARLTVVTCGSDGAVAVADDGSTWEVGTGPRGAHPTGSGDAFLAGLVLARHNGGDVPGALRTAAAAASANAQALTAGDVGAERFAAAYAAVAPPRRLSSGGSRRRD